jgi:glutamyl-tRNA synthetase
MEVRTRIAPSPTGHPHIGTLYMALFNLIFARHHGGKFILRIEDTDQTRSRKEYETSIFESLKWLGISWDEGPDVGGPYASYRQSERTELYQKACFDLLRAGKAYKCFTTAEELAEMRIISQKTGGRGGYDRRHRNLSQEEIEAFEASGRPYVIRLKVPLSGEVIFEDAIKGRISTPCSDVDDQVLLKSDLFPTYHLANVVDDHAMKITHVIRGDEWISSTPKHILLYEAFGWTPPVFAHMPLLLGIDGKKLSKRRNPTSAFYYKDSGYLPEALRNFLTLMGYSMAGDKEIYSLEEVIKNFDIKRVGVSGAVFDLKKLDWINQQYLINSVKVEDLWPRIQEWGFNQDHMSKLMPLVHTRIKTFGDFIDLCDFFFINNLKYTESLFCPRNIKPDEAAQILQAIVWALDESENWKRSGIEEASKKVTETFQIHYKHVMIPILFACFMGKHQGPPLFDSFEILGEHKARARLLKSIEFLGGISNKKMEKLQDGWSSKNCASIISTSNPTPTQSV